MPVLVVAVGWEAIIKVQVVTIRKRWELWSIDPAIASAFSPCQYDFSDGTNTFVECSGIIAKTSAHYTRSFVEILWKSQFGARGSHGGFVAGRSAASSAWDGPHGCGLGDGRRELDSRPNMPLWCSLITRVVKLKSAEARCPVAEAALKKELANIASNKVWDTENVHSLKGLLNHRDLPEAKLRRVFPILGVKN